MLRDPEKHGRAITIGRYAIYDVIAAGGMATVHYGRLLGPVGFSRTVAIKRLHAQFARDPEFVAMFIDEARLAARIRHPNVVQTLDIVAADAELFLVMEYVQGESLSRLHRASIATGGIPHRIASSIFCGALHGLHAAHEATDERGEPLGIVHRDMSPQNILVDVDGVSRVLDFGVAKAAGRVQTTGQGGKIKGKIHYMAPEQISGHVTRQSDIFATSVVLWELLTGKRLFPGDDPAQVLGKILTGQIEPPSRYVPDLPAGLDEVVMKGLERDPANRQATAREMAMSLESCLGMASPTQVGTWVESLARSALAGRAATIAEIESSSMRVVDRESLIQAGQPANDSREGVQTLVAPGSIADSIRVTFDPERRRLRPVVWIVAAAVILVAAAFVVGGHRPSPASPAVLAASAPPGGAASEAPSTRSVVTDSPPVSSPAVFAPSPSAEAASSPPFTPKAAPAKATHRSSSAPAKPATVAADCDPPFSLDAQGHKHWKDACFRKQGS